MKRYILVLLPIAMLLSFCSLFTEPGEDFNPRDLSWRIDTVAYPETFQTIMLKMWGNARDNIYLVGYCSDNDGQLWHYNGNEWTPIDLGRSGGGPVNNIYTLINIIGFDNGELFIAGDIGWDDRKSLIVHYDGSNWSMPDIPEGKDYSGLHAVGGNSPDNIWASGNRETIYHYNGQNWTLSYLDHKGVWPNGVSNAGRSFAGDQNRGFYLVTRSAPADDFLYKLVNDKWSLVDSSMGDIFDLYMTPSGKLIMAGRGGVFIWEDGVSTKIFEGRQVFGIDGTDENNLFITSRKQDFTTGVYHYNGSDWHEYELPAEWALLYESYDIKLIDEQLVVLGNGNGKSYVLFGK